MNNGIVNELVNLSNEELVELYENVLEHIDYLDDNILEEDGTDG